MDKRKRKDRGDMRSYSFWLDTWIADEFDRQVDRLGLNRSTFLRTAVLAHFHAMGWKPPARKQGNRRP